MHAPASLNPCITSSANVSVDVDVLTSTLGRLGFAAASIVMAVVNGQKGIKTNVTHKSSAGLEALPGVSYKAAPALSTLLRHEIDSLRPSFSHQNTVNPAYTEPGYSEILFLARRLPREN